jgi:sec-independent protein translocase protein TatA
MVLLFIGTTEIIVIGGIALLIFGGKKLPELMRGLGKGVKEFKEGMHDINNPKEENASEQSAAESSADEQKADEPMLK